MISSRNRLSSRGQAREARLHKGGASGSGSGSHCVKSAVAASGHLQDKQLGFKGGYLFHFLTFIYRLSA